MPTSCKLKGAPGVPPAGNLRRWPDGCGWPRCCNGPASLAWALILALLLPTAIHDAAAAAAPSRQRSSADRQPPREALVELDEVNVEGKRPGTSIADWFRRMAGKYRNTGRLSYAGGSAFPVWGTTDCFIFGSGPGLQCTLNLHSADGETNLNPGILLFGFDLNRPQIRYMAVEDTGSGEGGIGQLRGDTATFRTECVTSSGVPCFRTTAITARAGTDQVRMEVLIEVRGVPGAHYEIFMTRSSGARPASQDAGAGEAPADSQHDRTR